jgi:hypothetical protein
MDTNRQTAELGGIPLPEGSRRRVYKFGKKPTTGFFSVPVLAGNGNAVGRPPFTIDWSDAEQGLSAVVREREDGHLIAEVFCTDARLLHKAWVSVGLGGKVDALPIGKVIPLDTPAAADTPRKGGCHGSGELGLLTDAVKELGSELALVVFLLLDPEVAKP